MLLLFALVLFVWSGTYSLCPNSASDTMQLTNYGSTPDPPCRGGDVTFTLEGDLTKEVTSGTLNILLYHDKLKLIDKSENICDYVTCPEPVQPDFKITKTVKIPSLLVPLGEYHGNVSAIDQDGSRITCMEMQFDMEKC